MNVMKAIKRIGLEIFTYLRIHWTDCLLIFSLFLLCLVNALPNGANADFYPINGDFQNYNPVRRFLNGQIPYKDFSLYLGYGHIILGSITTFMFSKGSPNFMSSKIAFAFLSLFSFSVLSYVIFRFVVKKKNRTFALALTNVILLLLLFDPIIFSKILIINADFYNSVRSSILYANSARFLRGMAPAFFIGFFYLCDFVFIKFHILEKYSHLMQPILLGISSGIIVFYSNDYGISTAVCVFLIYLLKIIFSKFYIKKEKIKNLILFFLAFVISFFIFGELITFGHIGSYLSTTFGISGMQLWYYIGKWGEEKPYYFYNIDLYFFELLQGFISVVYLFFFLKDDSKRNNLRLFVPLILNSTAYAAANEYRLLSGGYLHEVSYSILWLTLVAEILNIIIFFYNKMKLKFMFFDKKIFISLIFIATIVYSIKNVPYSRINKNYVKVIENNKLDNPIRVDLSKAVSNANVFLEKDKKTFSTYSSAIESQRNQFQPSGYDYIIHVLGYDARKKYLDSFHKDDFDYVVTIKESFTDWEYWVRNANWFFYRELYKDYEVAWENEYERFWKLRENLNEDKYECSMDIERLSDASYKIKIFAPDIQRGFADLKAKYNIAKKNSKRAKLIFHTMMKVDNITAFSLSGSRKDAVYFLDSKADALFIGVPISNGVGEIVLTSKPEQDTYIDDFSIEVDSVFPCTVTENLFRTVTWLTDKNWTRGILNYGNTLLFDFNNNVLEEIKNADSLSCNGIEFRILNFDYDDNWIRVTVDKDANCCQFPNEIKFLEETR